MLPDELLLGGACLDEAGGLEGQATDARPMHVQVGADDFVVKVIGAAAIRVVIAAVDQFLVQPAEVPLHRVDHQLLVLGNALDLRLDTFQDRGIAFGLDEEGRGD